MMALGLLPGPAQIANLFRWLRADTFSGGTWVDQSGNGYNVPTKSGSPTAGATSDGINGQARVRYNGSTDSSQETTHALAQPYTRIMVLRPNSVTSTQLFGDGGSAINQGQFARNGAKFQMFAGGTSLLSTNSFTISTWYAVRGEYNGASSKCAFNGTVTSAGATIGAAGLTGETIGSGGGTPSFFAAVDVAEEIVYSRILTAGEVTTLNTYLTVRYGLTF
jgi:hypothetical protein